MKHIIIAVLIPVFLINCKEEAPTTTVKPAKVLFKKEGNLQLIKTDNDSVYKTLEIEIADDDYQRQTGLMYRTEMDDLESMLFVFPTAEYQSFYMRNTQIPLDIIYIGSDQKIINIHKNAKPLTEASVPSSAPAQYVLEINAGLSERWNIEQGDSISFSKD